MRAYLQFQGTESCVFTGAFGAVGDVPQAAMVPRIETTSSRRAMVWRDMEGLLVAGYATIVNPGRVPGLTRGVTSYHAM